MLKFLHVGVPSSVPLEDAAFVEPLGVYVTDPEQHPYRYEMLYFVPESPMAKEVQTQPHVAYMVENLEEHLKGVQVLLKPFAVSETARIAFIMKDGFVLELMEDKAAK